MKSSIAILLIAAVTVAGVLVAGRPDADYVAEDNFVTSNSTSASLPQYDPAGLANRTAGVAVRRDGYLYGPSLIGSAAYFPNGTLGVQRVADDMALWQVDRTIIDDDLEADVVVLTAAITANRGLNTMQDYVNVLYTNEWRNANPIGTDPGIFNISDDLLFSMERLSQNSFPLHRVMPNANLSFTIPDSDAIAIAGATMESLQAQGLLFVVDHIAQLGYQKTTVAPQRYGAACTAYFYISPVSGDFLPLAIKTNSGANLVYTPLDTASDWLLGKMVFNVNDFFFAQMFHLTVTHDLSEGVHLAALRTLSEHHPVMIVLDRLMLQGYSSRVVGEELCFNTGGHWDQLFYVNNIGCRQFVSDNWPTRGAFESSYMRTDLLSRGLINSTDGYPFKSFPFFDDARVIRDAQAQFFTSFVDSYYASQSDVDADYELQNWFSEVSSGASNVYGFPSASRASKDVLVDVLTHFAYIVSVVHHSLNGGDPIGSKATLPFHLNALYAPLPVSKGVTNLIPFLPPPPSAVHLLGFLASFNRPFYPSTSRTLEYAFAEASMLQRFNQATTDAAATFFAQMQDLSKEIVARTFDDNGLCMDMPFIYRTLNPNYIPFFSAV